MRFLPLRRLGVRGRGTVQLPLGSFNWPGLLDRREVVRNTGTLVDAGRRRGGWLHDGSGCVVRRDIWDVVSC